MLITKQTTINEIIILTQRPCGFSIGLQDGLRKLFCRQIRHTRKRGTDARYGCGYLDRTSSTNLFPSSLSNVGPTIEANFLEVSPKKFSYEGSCPASKNVLGKCPLYSGTAKKSPLKGATYLNQKNTLILSQASV